MYKLNFIRGMYIKEKHSLHKVWHYSRFQTSTGDLGIPPPHPHLPLPPWIREDCQTHQIRVVKEMSCKMTRANFHPSDWENTKFSIIGAAKDTPKGHSQDQLWADTQAKLCGCYFGKILENSECTFSMYLF